MQSPKVLALKYRPVIFEDLIGQEIISKTIYNSIKLNKIPNAFLFHGIRGTGKTSIARIIAKALNCSNGVENLCKKNFCVNCESINNSNHLDVIEQDCATATGIDSVRDLIEFCRYPPSTARFKVLILDEIQAMSKAGAQSLLKILEEPPEYVRFIFCTTEIKKILVTMLSRCTRFDLSRVKFEILLNYLKKISVLENGKIDDETLKLICKCSEGSVRDALSLLDRALLSTSGNKELKFEQAQKIFGHFDKSKIIKIIEHILEADEKATLERYRELFDAGVNPETFINEFLEIIYYIKNINFIDLQGTNFGLNNNEFDAIKNLNKISDNSTLMLFWQFTIKTLDEIKIVSNQNISIEMFLYRLLHLKEYLNKNFSNSLEDSLGSNYKNNNELKNETSSKKNPVSQIKVTTQKEEERLEKVGNKNHEKIETIDELINLCNIKREMKLKYNLETNVNLVKFEKNIIEISFNEKLDKDFVKVLSSKLYEWTNERWIISFSKAKGDKSKKHIKQINKKSMVENFKKLDEFKKIEKIFEDIVLEDIEEIND